MGFLSDLWEPVEDIWHGITGETAAEAATGAAATQAGYQQQALDYLKEISAVPQELRESALTQLAGVYGIPGYESTQADLIGRAKESPLYQEIMSSLPADEEAILRHASATGGLRSGGAVEALVDLNRRLSGEALSKAYGQQIGGLTGLAGLPTGAESIAGMTADIGRTLAGGQMGAAQSELAGTQNIMNMLGQFTGQGMGMLGGLLPLI